MKAAVLVFTLLGMMVGGGLSGRMPADYRGKPYAGAAQAIPGRVEAALFDEGGEGVAYHDADAVNHGSGELNYQTGHCEEGVSQSICHFREKEGMDISYVKKGADLRHQAAVMPEWKQLYIGWSQDGEWVNYTVDVKKAGHYRMVAMYSNKPQTVEFALNGKDAAECVLPEYPLWHDPDWMIWHTWNKADCGEIAFPEAGLQLLTLKYKAGNNFAYFDFVPVK